MEERVVNRPMSSEHTNRPVPRPRKLKGPSSSVPAAPVPHPHQPQPSELQGFYLASHSDEEIDDRHLYGQPNPSLADSTSHTGTYMYSGYNQRSSSSRMYTAPQPVYSPPAGPVKRSSLQSASPLNVTSPSSGSVAAKPFLSGVSPTESEVELSREHLVESKMKLVEEVGQLRAQHEVLTQELVMARNEKEQLRQEMDAELRTLRDEEHRLKVRIAQMQQNIDLMEKISKQGRRMSDQNTEQQERELRVKQEQLKEFEFSLKEMELRLEKRKLELQSEADLLYQRKKELDIREYDMENMASGMPDRRQQQQEMEIFRQKDQELQQRETSLTSKELDLKKMEKDLRKWEENVKMEDKRAQENTQRAREMWSESMRLKKEVEGMMAAQELQTKERLSSSSSAPSVVSPTSPQPAPVPEVSGAAHPISANQPQAQSSSTPSAHPPSHYATDGGVPPATTVRLAPLPSKPSSASNTLPPVAPVVDVLEDEMLARRLAMESNREWFDRDRELALKMAQELSGPVPKAEPVDESDFYTHLLLQEQMQDLGISDFPNSSASDTSTLRKKLTEVLEKEQKEKEELLRRDQELARRMQEEFNQANNNPT